MAQQSEVWVVLDNADGYARVNAVMSDKKAAYVHAENIVYPGRLEEAAHIRVERHDLLGHAPRYADLWSVSYDGGPMGAESRHPTERGFRAFEHIEPSRFVRAPNRDPTVEVDGFYLSVTGTDRNRCWEVFRDQASQHGIRFRDPDERPRRMPGYLP